MTRVLVAGVGYRNLRDYSCGVVLADRLAERDWPPHVSIEDLSYNPIAVVQRLHDEPPERRFDLAIVVGALPRRGRAPGACAIYRWDNVLPAPEEIHEAITEAVTGIIALDNTLIVGRHFQAWPATVVVIEIEPGAHEFGDELTPAVAAALDRATRVITALTASPASALELEEGPLAPGRLRHTGIVLATAGSHGITRH
jgi:hydrogenase maturation protease